MGPFLLTYVLAHYIYIYKIDDALKRRLVMAKAKSSNKLNALLTALIFILIGVLFVIYKGTILNWIMTALGIVLIVLGAIDLSKRRTVNGVVELVLGILLIVAGWAFVAVAMICMGAILIIKGVSDLLLSSKVKSVFGIIFSLLTIAIGVCLIVSYWVAIDWLFIAIGVVLIVDGVIAGISALAK